MKFAILPPLITAIASAPVNTQRREATLSNGYPTPKTSLEALSINTDNTSYAASPASPGSPGSPGGQPSTGAPSKTETPSAPPGGNEAPGAPAAGNEAPPVNEPPVAPSGATGGNLPGQQTASSGTTIGQIRTNGVQQNQRRVQTQKRRQRL